jgi:integrase
MGQIRKRGGVYWIRYYRNGRRIEESARTDKWEDARDLLRKQEGAIANGAPVSAKIGRLRFEDAAADLETDYSINKRRTLEHVQRHVKRLTKHFGGRRMTDITGAEVRRYIATRQEAGAKNATINRELAALRRMFTLAVDAGKLLMRPKIPMLQEDNARQGFFEVEQFQAVLRHLPKPLQAVATFAYFTGWRRSEIIGLEWSRVDRKAGIVRLDVGTTKNKDGREFTYRDVADLKAVIERQWQAHEALKKLGSDADPGSQPTICPLVFHRKGKPIKSYRKAWERACRLAGCPGRLMHDFRRTAVRNLERAGVSRSVATRITGHKTEAVYRRYAIVSSSDLADAARKLQAMTGTITGTIGLVTDNTETAKATA